MKKRIGDRRGRARFEIVGTLTGTLETWQRFKLLNLGAGGALVEAASMLPAGSRVSGRLSVRGRLREVRGEVRRVATTRDHTGGIQDPIGIEWTDRLPPDDDVFTMEPAQPIRSGHRHAVDRRKSIRVAPTGGAEMGRPTWSTVELVDISTSGVLFASPVPLAVGEHAQLRVRLGSRSFAAQIEIRRGDARRSSHSGYRLGAMFRSLDEGSRFTLDEFIGDARR